MKHLYRFAGLLCMIFSYAYASHIVETHVYQTFTIGQQYDLDLNDDSNTDYTIICETGAFGNVVRISCGLNKFVAAIHLTSPSAADWAKMYDFGDSLDGSDWIDNSTAIYLARPQDGIGYFQGAGDKYVGFYMQMMGMTHWGWLKINIPSDASSFTIISYAYQFAHTHQPITAGESDVVGIEEALDEEQIKIAQDQDFVRILTDGMIPEGTEILVSDLSGKLIINVPMKYNRTNIDVSGYQAGIYFLTIRKGTFSMTKKIFISH